MKISEFVDVRELTFIWLTGLDCWAAGVGWESQPGFSTLRQIAPLDDIFVKETNSSIRGKFQVGKKYYFSFLDALRAAGAEVNAEEAQSLEWVDSEDFSDEVKLAREAEEDWLNDLF
jgi:CTP synthase (UTP-ammonia lyase)